MGRRLGFTVLVTVTMFACVKPKPPIIVPQQARVLGVGTGGLDLVVRLDLDNPNRCALTGRSVMARVTVDRRIDLGSVTLPRPFELEAGQRQTLDVPLSMPWTGIAQLLRVGMFGGDVPYDVDGTVNMGGRLLNVDLPFHIAGTLSRDQVLRAGKNSLRTLLSPEP